MPRSILKRTKKRTPRKRSKRRVKIGGRVRGKKPKRPYKLDKAARLRRRHRRRHPTSKVHGHHKRMRRESETMNYLLHQLLKTASSTEDPYNYDPRHHSKDPEYKFAGERMQEFKRGVPASGGPAAVRGKLPQLGERARARRPTGREPSTLVK